MELLSTLAIPAIVAIGYGRYRTSRSPITRGTCILVVALLLLFLTM
ncbi:MAG: hypothetical protein ACRC3Z_11200 [Phocaeicola sp.]